MPRPSSIPITFRQTWLWRLRETLIRSRPWQSLRSILAGFRPVQSPTSTQPTSLHRIPNAASLSMRARSRFISRAITALTTATKTTRCMTLWPICFQKGAPRVYIECWSATRRLPPEPLVLQTFPAASIPICFAFLHFPCLGTNPKKLAKLSRPNWNRGLDSNEGLASSLAIYQTLYGDWRELFHTVDRIEAVSKADIRRVANQVFVPTNRTVGVIENAAAASGGAQ